MAGCDVCENGRFLKCPVCTEEKPKDTEAKIKELQKELSYLDVARSRGRGIDEVEYEQILDEIKELEDEL